MKDQCITVCQRTARCTFVHYSYALFPYFTVEIYIFACCTFFMQHFFDTASFPCCTFLCINNLLMHFFLRCTLFMYCTISCCTLTRCNVFVSHSSPVALFAQCNFFLLHFVHVALFSKVQPGPPQTSKIQGFATIVKKAVKYC